VAEGFVFKLFFLSVIDNIIHIIASDVRTLKITLYIISGGLKDLFLAGGCI
jgi:hypothetical protein